MPVPCRTLARLAEVTGTGLFTGRPAVVRIHPASDGIWFRIRGETFPAVLAALAPPMQGAPSRNTCLAAPGGATPVVLTVEHVLSALVGMGITDALVEVDGPEVPIGDGSASMFVEAIDRAGTAKADGDVEPVTIDREITVESGDARIIARPRLEAGCHYRYKLDYGGGAIPAQAATFDLLPDSQTAAIYASEIAPARTFCLQAEAEAMQAMGLFTNLTPRDMLVFGKDGPIDNTLRFDNEPARHKLLDLIGDLALVGRPLQADITAVRAGHALNHELARAIFESARY